MDLIEKKPDKDVIYTLRFAHQKQAQLILLADQKAQILSGLVLVVLTLLGTRLIYMNTDRFLVSIEPVTAILLLLFFSSEIVAITLGILVVMPSLPKSKNGNESIDAIRNPLFFGAFADYEEDEYLDHIADNIVCNDTARRFLAKDIYQSGKVLSTKYRKLSYAYRYALIGFIFLVLTFLSLLIL